MEVEGEVGQEINQGTPLLTKDKSQPPVLSETFYSKDAEKGRKYHLLRKAGDEVLMPRMAFDDEDKPKVSYHREKMTENQLRQTLIFLRIYQELGLNVPDLQLRVVDGKTALFVEDLGSIKNIDISSPTVGEAQAQEVKRHYIASYLLNNPYFVFSLKEKSDGQLILSDVLAPSKDHEPGIFYSPANPLLTNYIGTKKFEKAFGLGIDPKGKIEQDLRQKIEGLSSQRIAEIVLEAGLPLEETRSLLAKILTAKETTLRMLTPENLEEALHNTPEWDKLDGILEQSEGNKPFKDVAEKAQRAIETIKEVRKIIKLITGESDEELQSGADLNLSPKELGEILEGLRFRPNETELIEDAQKLLKIKRHLESKRKALPELFFKLRGYAQIERALINKIRTLEITLGQYINSMVEQTWKELGEALKGVTLHDLVNYLSPTKRQLESIAELAKIIGEDEIRTFILPKNYNLLVDILIPRVKRRRIDFKHACEERSRVLVSHLSRPSLIRETLKEGSLRSSLKQKEVGKTPAVNSPAGERDLLPQLTFAINGAALGYGGLDEEAVGLRKNNEEVVTFSRTGGKFVQSVGFVAPYSLIVKGRKFVELPSTSPDLRDELHVFDPQYSDEHRVGTQISVDDMWLFVPGQDKQEWEDFLAKPKEQGGAGKSQDWIQSYLRTYPEWVDLDTYLRYFADRESLGIPPEPLGIFITNEEEMTIHKGMKKQRPFVWISQSV